MKQKPGIFLCHSHRDRKFVQRLASDLRRSGAYVWIDEAEIHVGDSLLQKISNGITNMEYVGAIISKSSVKSRWVQKELEIAMTQEISGSKIKVLPLLLEDCDLPIFLSGKLYADFTKEISYEKSLKKIIDRMGLVYFSETFEGQRGIVRKDFKRTMMYRDFCERIKEFFKPRKAQISIYEDGSGIDFIKIPSSDGTFELFNHTTNPDPYDLLNRIFSSPGKIITGIKVTESSLSTGHEQHSLNEKIAKKYSLNGHYPGEWKGTPENIRKANLEWERWHRERSAVVFELSPEVEMWHYNYGERILSGESALGYAQTMLNGESLVFCNQRDEHVRLKRLNTFDYQISVYQKKTSSYIKQTLMTRHNMTRMLIKFFNNENWHFTNE